MLLGENGWFFARANNASTGIQLHAIACGIMIKLYTQARKNKFYLGSRLNL